MAEPGARRRLTVAYAAPDASRHRHRTVPAYALSGERRARARQDRGRTRRGARSRRRSSGPSTTSAPTRRATCAVPALDARGDDVADRRGNPPRAERLRAAAAADRRWHERRTMPRRWRRCSAIRWSPSSRCDACCTRATSAPCRWASRPSARCVARSATSSRSRRRPAHRRPDDGEGVVIQPMIAGGVETMIGITDDPLFGPLVAFGLGGIHVEVLGDVRFRIAPLTDRDVDELLHGIRGVQAARGIPRPPAGRPRRAARTPAARLAPGRGSARDCRTRSESGDRAAAGQRLPDRRRARPGLRSPLAGDAVGQAAHPDAVQPANPLANPLAGRGRYRDGRWPWHHGRQVLLDAGDADVVEHRQEIDLGQQHEIGLAEDRRVLQRLVFAFGNRQRDDVDVLAEVVDGWTDRGCRRSR